MSQAEKTHYIAAQAQRSRAERSHDVLKGFNGDPFELFFSNRVVHAKRYIRLALAHAIYVSTIALQQERLAMLFCGTFPFIFVHTVRSKLLSELSCRVS